MDNKLLTIELANTKTTPIVKYNGEEIEGKVAVFFNWKTSDADDEGYCAIKLEYLEIVDSEPIAVDVKHSRKDYVKLEQKLVNNKNSPNMLKSIDFNNLY